MAQTEPTFGPLHIEQATHESILGKENGSLAICNEQRQEIARVYGYAIGYEEAKRYVALFKIAPDMLSILVKLVVWADTHPRKATFSEIDKAREITTQILGHKSTMADALAYNNLIAQARADHEEVVKRMESQP